MLWTALHLNQLSLDCTPHAPECAFAVVERRRIAAAGTAARAAGVRAGQNLAAALALAPTLAWVERDPERETAALEALSLWALQFTADVAPMPQGLLLETGGSARLFGSLPALVERIAAGLDAQGYAATLASAPTPAGARMLARSGFTSHLSTPAELRAILPRLPAPSLDSAAGFAATFETLGLKTVADLLALPRDGLTRRFGAQLVDELDRAFGHRPDPLATLVAPESFASTITLPAPVESAALLGFACRRAFTQLEGYLRAGKRAVDRIDLRLYRERDSRHAGPEQHLSLSFFEPTASSERFMRILAEHLNRTTLAGRIERIRVEAAALPLSVESTRSLLPEPARASQGVGALLERLEARLGRECLSGATMVADHRPARAGVLHTLDPREATAGAPRHAPRESARGPRPVWLVEPPRALQEIDGKPHHDGPLTLVTGPECIESGWWDCGGMTRDYFIARTADNALLWIFRERHLPAGWFLQGYFG